MFSWEFPKDKRDIPKAPKLSGERESYLFSGIKPMITVRNLSQKGDVVLATSHWAPVLTM